MKANIHASDGRSFTPDRIGFYTPRCSCGWKFGPVPDEETLVDVLMAHAFEAGIQSERKASR